jgi:hypothetical protein
VLFQVAASARSYVLENTEEEMDRPPGSRADLTTLGSLLVSGASAVYMHARQDFEENLNMEN